MNVKLTEHAAALLKVVRAHRHEPVENILEHALEALAREDHIQIQNARTPTEAQRQAVIDMLEFVKRNRVRLAGISVKDLIHEGHRI